MLKQFEIILTSVCLVLSAVLLVMILIRTRNIFFKNNARVPIWNKELGIWTRVGKLAMAVALILLAPGIIFFIFIVAVPSAVIRNYAKTIFIMIFSAWALMEILLWFRRLTFFSTVIACIALAVYLFPLIPRSLKYPANSECVTLELPVRGTWLAGQAGASEITNGHLTRPYAIDILKLGSDGRMYKGNESAVTDYFSYNEPVYAPADGWVTQIVDGIESDLIGSMDEEHPGGNYIIIDIGDDKYVFFAHLKKGSIAVEEGQFVEEGTFLGTVGNSGYSTHPHLHMHVQDKPIADADGMVTYPFRFNEMKRKRLMFWNEISDGYLLRNDRFTDTS